MMNLRIRDVFNLVAPVNQPNNHVRFVKEIGVFLIKASDLKQGVSTEGRICSGQGQIALRVRSRVWIGCFDAFEAMAIAKTIANGDLALEFDAGMISNVSTNGSDIRVGIPCLEFIEPIGLGDGIVVNKANDIPCGEGNPDIAGL
ncbi:hypothetical protein C404_16035 [Ralstonia sp. AU12-08]|nr:hypothetical protein C404_16035 [Ralstonia sp. AU12-08]